MLISLLFYGCGQSGGYATINAENEEKIGYLRMSDIQGVSYESVAVDGTTLNGKTDTNGSFKYFDGGTVKFNVGALDLGKSVVAVETIMVKDLSGNTDKGNNIVRLLLSLSGANKNDTKIVIPEEISTAVTENNFQPDFFESDFFGQNFDTSFLTLIDKINETIHLQEPLVLTSLDDALSHMDVTTVSVTGIIQDAATGFPLSIISEDSSIDVRILGAVQDTVNIQDSIEIMNDAGQVLNSKTIDYNENIVHETKLGYGLLDFRIKDLHQLPSNEHPIRMIVAADVEGYITSSIQLTITEEATDFSLSMVQIVAGATPSGVATAQSKGTIENGTLTDDIDIVSGSIDEVAGYSRVNVPAGTSITSQDGTPLSGIITIESTYFNSTDIESIDNFPGGLQNVEVEDGSTEDESFGFFITAGFTSIDIRDELGNKAENFSDQITVSMKVHEDTINPETKEKLKVGDDFPVWSYKTDTGKWLFEGNGTASGPEDIVDGSGNKQSFFTISFQTNHLSFYSVSWIKKDRCAISNRKQSEDPINIKVEGNDKNVPLTFSMKSYGGKEFGKIKKQKENNYMELNISNAPRNFPVIISAKLSKNTSVNVTADKIPTGKKEGEKGLYVEDLCALVGTGNHFTLNVSDVPEPTALTVKVMQGDEPYKKLKRIYILKTNHRDQEKNQDGSITLNTVIVGTSYDVKVVLPDDDERQINASTGDLKSGENIIIINVTDQASLTVQLTNTSDQKKREVFLKNGDSPLTKAGETNSSGTLLIENLSAGDEYIINVKDNAGMLSGSINLIPGSNVVNIPVPALASVEVQASNEGTAVKNGKVYIKSEHLSRQNVGYTDNKGTLIIPDLIVGKKYTIYIDIPSADYQSYQDIIVKESNNIIVFELPIVAQEKTIICHKPGTNAENTLTVSESALSAHIEHGDVLGSCSDLDTDNDGVVDNVDTDDDNDGVLDDQDAFPLNATESLDTDEDGVGNNTDTDDDNDGVLDDQDAFPLDATESLDTDEDGVGNNTDTDDDNDGVLDDQDAFPLNATESLDTDNDGTGNNVDTDDDGDNIPDTEDSFPLERNKVPISNDATLTTTEDTSINKKLVANDPEGSTLFYEIVDQGSFGIASIIDSETGDFTYTPNAGYFGNDNFSFKVNDGMIDSNIATISIVIQSSDTDGDGVPNEQDAFPSDATEHIDTDNDGIGNNTDTDDDGDGIDDEQDKFPLDSSESYDTDEDGIGNNTDLDDDNDGMPDDFEIRNNLDPLNSNDADEDTDGDGLTNIDEYLLGIDPNKNETPTISDIQDITIDEDTSTYAITFNVEDSETEDTQLTILATSMNTDIVPNENIKIDSNGSNSTITITPADNQFGTVSISITVSDGTSSATDTFTLTIFPINDQPSVSNIANQSIDKDTTTQIEIIVGDFETDTSDLTVFASSSNEDIIPNSNISIDGDGTVRTITVKPQTNATGSVDITVTVDDGEQETSNTFTITIGASNDPPTISEIAAQSTEEDTPITIDITVEDTETIADELLLTVKSHNTELISDTDMSVSGSGKNRTITIIPLHNTHGETTLTVSVSDGTSSTEQHVKITINPVNDAPTMSILNNQTINEDSSLTSLHVSINDEDTNVDKIEISSTSSNTDLVPNKNIDIGKTGENRSIMITPLANQTGMTTITLTASDGSKTSSASFVLTISPVNDAPSTHDSTLSTNEDQPANGSLIASDVDNDDLIYSIVSNGINGTANITDTSIGLYTYTPNENAHGTDSFTFKVNDGTADSNFSTITVTISEENDAPIAVNSTIDTDEDTETTGTLSVIHPDDHETLFTIIQNGSKGIATITDTSTGTYTYTPNTNANGYDIFTFKTSDEFEESNTATVTVTILDVNDIPTASDGSLVLNEDSTANSVLVASDVDGDTLFFNIVNQGTYGIASIINETTGTYMYTPDHNFSGSDSFSFNVNDGTIGSNNATITLTINAINDAPTITEIPDISTNKNTSINDIEFTIDDAETQATHLTVSAISSNTDLITHDNIKFDGTEKNRTVTLIPLTNHFGITTITLKVGDGVNTTTSEFTLTVNDEPINQDDGSSNTTKEDEGPSINNSWIDEGPSNDNKQDEGPPLILSTTLGNSSKQDEGPPLTLSTRLDSNNKQDEGPLRSNTWIDEGPSLILSTTLGNSSSKQDEGPSIDLKLDGGL